MKEPQEVNAQPSAKQDDSPEAVAARALKAALSRRGLFGAGLFGAAAMLAQACSSTSFNGASGSGTKKASTQPNGGKDSTDGPGPNAGKECTDYKTKNSCTDDTNCNWDSSASQCSAKGTECGTLTTKEQCTGDTSCQWDDKKTSNQCTSKPGILTGNGGPGTPGGGKDAGGGTGSTDSKSSGLGAGTDSSACYANTAQKLDTSGLPDAAGGYKPTVKFYGRDNSGLVAMQFGDGASDITQVVITSKSGQLLALHGITGADMKGGAWRPIVIDNISLKDDSIQIVIQTKDKTYKHTEPKAYFNTFNGKQVVDLSMGALPAGTQSVTRFAEGAGTFGEDQNSVYPNKYNPDVKRYLQTVKTGSTWTPVSGPTGINGTVTDIMGNTIADIGGSEIIEHQLFCTYVDAGGSLARTMLHIG